MEAMEEDCELDFCLMVPCTPDGTGGTDGTVLEASLPDSHAPTTPPVPKDPDVPPVPKDPDVPDVQTDKTVPGVPTDKTVPGVPDVPVTENGGMCPVELARDVSGGSCPDFGSG